MSVLTANGQTYEFTAGGTTHVHLSDNASGGLGGGTFAVQQELRDGSWEDVQTLSWTTLPVDERVHLVRGKKYRGSLTGATSPTLYFEFNFMG